LDRLDVTALDLDRQHEARAHRLAVDEHRAGAANAVLAADMGAGGADLVTQEVRQQHARFRLADFVLTVQAELDPVQVVLAQPFHNAVSLMRSDPMRRTSSRRYLAEAWMSS